MSDLDRVDLEVSDRPEPRPAPSGGGGGPWLKIVAALAAVVLLVVGYLYLRPKEEPAPAEPVAAPAQAPAPEVEEVAEALLVLPALDASDELIRRLVGELSSRPEIARWLAHEELIRRFVAAVDSVAEGVSPRTHLTFLAPEDGPRVSQTGDGSTLLDAASYRRYDPLVAVVTSLDTVGTVSLYRAVKPLIDEAYRDLGYPYRSFDETLDRALVHLLETPVVEGLVRLEPAVASYRYADPQLEGLSAAQKHLLRTGPEGTRSIQGKLRELALALGIPSERLPAPRVYRSGGA